MKKTAIVTGGSRGIIGKMEILMKVLLFLQILLYNYISCTVPYSKI